MTALVDYDADGRPAAEHLTKRRQCLSCTGSFDSVWFGERICKVCKQSSAWRAGVAYRSAKFR